MEFEIYIKKQRKDSETVLVFIKNLENELQQNFVCKDIKNVKNAIREKSFIPLTNETKTIYVRSNEKCYSNYCVFELVRLFHETSKITHEENYTIITTDEKPKEVWIKINSITEMYDCIFKDKTMKMQGCIFKPEEYKLIQVVVLLFVNMEKDGVWYLENNTK